MFNSFGFNSSLFNSAASSQVAALLRRSLNKGMRDMILVKLSEATAARRRFLFDLVSSADYVTPQTGQSVSLSEIKVCQNGGSEATSTGSITEIGGGLYYYEATASEVSTLGQITVRVNRSGCLAFKSVGQVVGFDPYSATVTVGTNNDKTGYALAANAVDSSVFTQSAADRMWSSATRTLSAFSFNVTVGGYASGQDPASLLLSTPANKLATTAAGEVNINLAQSVSIVNVSSKTTHNVGECLCVAWAEGAGKWTFSGNTLTVYGPDATSTVRAFTLNDTLNPTSRT